MQVLALTPVAVIVAGVFFIDLVSNNLYISGMDELTDASVVNFVKKLPALEMGNIRILGSREGYDKLGVEKLQEINFLLRGNRKDRRKAAAMLRKVGLRVIARNDDESEPAYTSVQGVHIDQTVVDELTDQAQQLALYEGESPSE